jgi:hypothetical protein
MKNESPTFMSFKEFKTSFSGLYPISANCSDLGNSFHADFSGYKFDRLDGIQIIVENGVYEVSEGQAGKDQNELHVLKEYKNLGSAINFIVKLNNGSSKPKAIKVWN